MILIVRFSYQHPVSSRDDLLLALQILFLVWGTFALFSTLYSTFDNRILYAPVAESHFPRYFAISGNGYRSFSQKSFNGVAVNSHSGRIEYYFIEFGEIFKKAIDSTWKQYYWFKSLNKIQNLDYRNSKVK